jgi:hypothetical protein
MSNYVLAFRGQNDRTVTAEEEAAWGAWFKEIGPSIVDPGHRVGRVASLGYASSGKLTLTGYVVVTAADLQQAVALAEGCPGLRSGGGVEVGEFVEA